LPAVLWRDEVESEWWKRSDVAKFVLLMMWRCSLDVAVARMPGGDQASRCRASRALREHYFVSAPRPPLGLSKLLRLKW
jgi:hypothetical protein